MKKLSDVAAGELSRLRRARPAHHTEDQIEMGPDGQPADRTICPWCFGRAGNCRQCAGTGVVCPTCRGGRRLRSGNENRIAYVGCHSCTDWIDQGQHSWDEHNDPRFQRVTGREAAAIQYYWQKRQEEQRQPVTPSGGDIDDSDLPF